MGLHALTSAWHLPYIAAGYRPQQPAAFLSRAIHLERTARSCWGQLRLGQHPFHVGILGLFFGHPVADPRSVWDALGVSHSKQGLAMPSAA